MSFLFFHMSLAIEVGIGKLETEMKMTLSWIFHTNVTHFMGKLIPFFRTMICFYCKILHMKM
jgi:hypothetical protein